MPIYESDGTNTYLNTGSSWSADDIGRAITVTFDAVNSAFDGSFTVAEIVTDSRIRVTPPGIIDTGFVSPASVSIVEVIGTDQLPTVSENYKQFIKLHASIAIRQSRKQECNDLEKKLTKYTDEVRTSVANRAEEPSQPPLSRGFGSWAGFDSDW